MASQHPIVNWLVVYHPPEKWWTSSVGMIIPFPTEWKVIKFHGSSHHQAVKDFIFPYLSYKIIIGGVVFQWSTPLIEIANDSPSKTTWSHMKITKHIPNKNINKNTSDIFKPWNTPPKKLTPRHLSQNFPWFHHLPTSEPTIPGCLSRRVSRCPSVSPLHVETDASLAGAIGIGRHDLPATNLAAWDWGTGAGWKPWDNHGKMVEFMGFCGISWDFMGFHPENQRKSWENDGKCWFQPDSQKEFMGLKMG